MGAMSASRQAQGGAAGRSGRSMPRLIWARPMAAICCGPAQCQPAGAGSRSCPTGHRRRPPDLPYSKLSRGNIDVTITLVKEPETGSELRHWSLIAFITTIGDENAEIKHAGDDCAAASTINADSHAVRKARQCDGHKARPKPGGERHHAGAEAHEGADARHDIGKAPSGRTDQI